MFDSKIRLTVFAVAILLGIAMLFMQWRISSEVGQAASVGTQDHVLAEAGADELPVVQIQASADDVILASPAEPNEAALEGDVMHDEDLGPVLSEDASAVDKVKFAFAWIWHKLFGPKAGKDDLEEVEDTYEMSCKTKNGGKVCQVIRE